MHNLPEFYSEFDKPLNINEENVIRCNNLSQFEAGDHIKNYADIRYKKFFDLFADVSTYSEEQKSYLLSRAKKWKEFVEEASNDELRRRANFIPVNVAGPAKYDFGKAQKQSERDLEKANEYVEKLTAFLENTQIQLDKLTPIEKVLENYRNGKYNDDVTITFDDPYALEKMTAKLEFLTNKQSEMKTANKHYRKNGTMKGFCSDEKADKWDIAIKQRVSFSQIPYDSYELTSINEKIKRCKARIEKFNIMQNEKPFKDYDFEGGQVVANYSEDRLQIIFDQKPDDATRNQLKCNGFRWSPTFSAWQRQLTKNAYSIALKLFERIDKQ